MSTAESKKKTKVTRKPRAPRQADPLRLKGPHGAATMSREGFGALPPTLQVKVIDHLDIMGLRNLKTNRSSTEANKANKALDDCLSKPKRAAVGVAKIMKNATLKA